jgi:hypothetical protein
LFYKKWIDVLSIWSWSNCCCVVILRYYFFLLLGE